ncbi:hypothetical protein [Tropicibacter alexandrii]|uniref:hypothetical protein n=1 Tax=Tropicibacter alexandrii TaxID=2267683 RepID=UPI000EF5390C|nr:hypothetical protein [Tropicibacter alexandrii]
MTKFIATAIAAAGFALPVVAQDVVIMDTDGDGMISRDEATAYYSTFVENNFDNIDTSNDGVLQSSEIAAAEANAWFPLSDGND